MVILDTCIVDVWRQSSDVTDAKVARRHDSNDVSSVGSRTDGGAADSIVEGADVEEEFAGVDVDEAHDAVLTEHSMTLQRDR